MRILGKTVAPAYIELLEMLAVHPTPILSVAKNLTQFAKDTGEPKTYTVADVCRMFRNLDARGFRIKSDVRNVSIGPAELLRIREHVEWSTR